jgi:hypothetical protein
MVVIAITACLVGGHLEAGESAVSSPVEGIKYDPSERFKLSTQELLNLLTHRSLELNLGDAGELVWLGPTKRSDSGGKKSGSFRYGTYSMPMVFASATPYPTTVIDELVSRNARDELIATFSSSDDELQLKWVEVALERLRSPEVDRALASFTCGKATELKSYLAFLYLAETGQEAALARLACDYYELPLSSLEKAEVAELFGRHMYFPAARKLVETLEAASGNLADAALKSLTTLYPDGKRGFSSPDKAVKYWSKRITTAASTSGAELCEVEK